MALLSCRDCGASISDVAVACPYCGRPRSANAPPPIQLRRRVRVDDMQPMGIALAMLFAVIVGAWIATPTERRKATQPTSASAVASTPMADLVASNRRYADSLLKGLSVAQIRALPDSLLNFVANYGTIKRKTLAKEQADRAGPSETSYQTLIANVWPGKRLYLKTDHAYIGVIQDVEDDHLFPDGSQRDGVMVEFPDGSSDWIPRGTLQQIYVTK
jgi:hypothetical protein